MNYKERKRARLMYLFPLMLALTGLALLVLDWAVALTSLNALTDLKYLLQHNWYILIFPLILMLLYLFRAPSLGAYLGACVAAVLFLIQLIVSFLAGRSGGAAAGLVLWIPGHTLFASIRSVADGWTLGGGLRLFSDLALVLCNVSAIFSCMVYVSVKNRSDQRRAQLQADQAEPELDPDL